MKAEMELVKQIKTFGAEQAALQSEREKIFLSNLKNKLEVYMYQNPARPVTASLCQQLWGYAVQTAKPNRLHTEQSGSEIKIGKFKTFYYNIKGSDPFVNLKNVGIFNNSYTNTAALTIIILAIGIGTIASASQASLPGDNFYPIKILSEELRSALTVSPTAKARLEVEFSTKRIEEIKKLIQKNGIESKDIDAALSHLQKNTTKAADIINEEKRKGNDVSELAKDIEKRNSSNQNMLKQILKKSEKKISEPSDKDINSGDKSNPGKSAKEKEETKGEKEAKKSNSSLQIEKPETKIDEPATISSPKIKAKTRTEEKDDKFDFDGEDEENND